MKLGSLNLLEPSGSVLACTGSAFIIIISSFYSLWSTGHPWRTSKCCDLQLSPWPHSMIFLCFLFPYIPKPYSHFPFHARGVAFYIRPFTLYFSFFNSSIFKVCKLLAYSTRSQWWVCHLSLWAGWFSVGVSSPSLWRSPFSTRQWCWFWSTLGILFPQYPPYLVNLPLSATWGGARWETSNSTREFFTTMPRKRNSLVCCMFLSSFVGKIIIIDFATSCTEVEVFWKLIKQYLLVSRCGLRLWLLRKINLLLF